VRDFYQVGGTLRADAPSYVERPADKQLLQLCCEGRFTYVLAPGQSGKTSLVVRTRQRLKEQGVSSVYIDLNTVGSEDVTAEQWYLSLVVEIRDQLDLDVDFEAWWETKIGLSVVKRFSDFLRSEVIGRVDNRVVIFVDEIDLTLRLRFAADEFFASLRALYNARAMYPNLGRLSFVFLGATVSSDFTSGIQRTVLDVSEQLELNDFVLDSENAKVLMQGLKPRSFLKRAFYWIAGNPRPILERVFYWTAGHPRLTQELCKELKERAGSSPHNVDSVADNLVLESEGASDSTFEAIRGHALGDPRALSWLPLYSQILRGSAPEAETTSDEQKRLWLVGLIKKSPPGRRLEVRNRLIGRVFGADWADRTLRARLAATSFAASATPARVFISSTSSDLEPYRAVAEDAVLDLDWHPVGMEHFGTGASQGIVEECTRRVVSSDVVLAIIAWRRGGVPGPEQGGDGQSSFTALEIEAAKKTKKPIVVFMATNTWPGHLWEDDQDARNLVSNFRKKLNRLAVFFKWEDVIEGDREPLPNFRAKVSRELVLLWLNYFRDPA
jgi:hypothetical protein